MAKNVPVREKRTRTHKTLRIEWPTIALTIACYTIWGTVMAFNASLPWLVWIPIAILCTALQASLMHEVCHGHPTNRARWNEWFVVLPIGMFIPYRRFKDLHLKHHNNEWLTDPYEDPESFYLASEKWAGITPWHRWILIINNTLLGRLIVGPGINITRFVTGDIRRIMAGDKDVQRAWIVHAVAAVPVVIWIVLVGQTGLMFYLLAIAYPGYALIMIRTFAEHRADEDKNRRSVLVAQPRLLSWLFLNNNLHYLHHKYPNIAWYRLPALFRRQRDTLIEENGGYVFHSYRDQFLRYGVRPKEPVPHPLWNLANRRDRLKPPP